MPIHAAPSNVSSSTESGTSRPSSSGSTRQCRNARSTQLCALVHGSSGIGHGRCSLCSVTPAWRAAVAKRSEIAAERLLALDRFEERLEVAVPEAARAVTLDHLEEERRPVLRRLREDLQQVAVVVAVGEDPQSLQVVPALVDLADAARCLLVVRVGCREEDHTTALQRLDGPHDVRRLQRDVLRARSVIELEVLVDLALALALGRLVD